MSARIQKNLKHTCGMMWTSGLNCESFDRVKLSRLQICQLQLQQIFEPLKWLVAMLCTNKAFSVMESLICEYTDSINIVCQG